MQTRCCVSLSLHTRLSVRWRLGDARVKRFGRCLVLLNQEAPDWSHLSSRIWWVPFLGLFQQLLGLQTKLHPFDRLRRECAESNCWLCHPFVLSRKGLPKPQIPSQSVFLGQSAQTLTPPHTHTHSSGA